MNKLKRMRHIGAIFALVLSSSAIAAEDASLCGRKAKGIVEALDMASVLPPTKQEVATVVAMLLRYQPWDQAGKPLPTEARPLVSLISDGSFIAAKEYAVSVKSDHPIFKSAVLMADSVYAPFDAHDAEAASLGEVLERGVRNVESAKKKLGKIYKIPGASLLLRGAIYNEANSEALGKMVLCGNADEATVKKVLAAANKARLK